jgi:hypothetical protein
VSGLLRAVTNVLDPMPGHDAELDTVVAMLEDACLLEEIIDDGPRLTARGAQVGHAMAMSGDGDGPLAVLDPLLDEAGG